MKKILFLRRFCLMAVLLLCSHYAIAVDGPVGFANYPDLGLYGVTGGAGGDVVRVGTRAEFDAAVAGDTPKIVILTATITGDGLQACNDEVAVGSNKTIMALSPDVKINGINLVASGKQNIIIRNITLLNGKPDGLTFKNCHHVWIDHCDLSASDDGLLDFTLGSSYMTVSYCKIHNHNKVALCNSGTQHYEDIGKQRVTYHHNYWYQNTQRNPRIGYGLGHVFNNYYENISSYCIGYHSHAKVLSENNHFASSAKSPLNSMYSSDPTWVTYAEARDRGSYVANGSIGTQQGTVFEPTDYYDYTFALEDARGLNTSVPQQAGPVDGLCDEPILFPGNGAIGVIASQRLVCSPVADATLQGVRIVEGLDANALATASLVSADAVSLKASTDYMWQAVYQKAGKEIVSPVYRFRTAGMKAAKPYPADGEKQANLREAVAEKQFNGNMKLRWQHAFNAAKYQVELWADGEEHKTFTATSNVVDPGFLKHNTNYNWTVTPLDANGTPLASPEKWTFSAKAVLLPNGTHKLTSFTRNANAWKQPFNSTVPAYDGTAMQLDSVVVPDAGPGCAMYVFDGDDNTRVEFALCFRNKEATASNSGKSYFAVYVNDEQVEWWQGHQATVGFYTRKLGKHVTLKKGDEIRVEFYTTIQSSNWTQLAWLDVRKSRNADGLPEPQEAKTPQQTYDDPFAESWWPNATTFHQPNTTASQNYEIVYFPAIETSVKGIYALTDKSTAEWVDGRFKINSRSIYSPEKDDLKSTKTANGIVCGENATMADSRQYSSIFSLSIKNTSHVRCYVAGSSSNMNRMQVTVIPADDPSMQTVVYSTKGVGKNIPDYIDIDLDPTQSYRLLFDGEKAYAMFLGAVRLYAPAADGIDLIRRDELDGNGAIYNLAGQKVGADYKGIVIKNGIKTVNK